VGMFKDVFDHPSNNPEGWSAVEDQLDSTATLFTGSLLPSFTVSVRTAEEAAARLYIVVVTAKQKNIDLQLMRMVNQAPGKSFGAKLINWMMGKIDIEIARDLRTAWASYHQQMSSTIEMLIKDVLDDPDYSRVVTTVEQAEKWIARQGGMGQIHMDFMSYRRNETTAEKSRKRAAYEKADQIARQQEATDAGFATFEALQAHRAEMAKKTREERVRSNFDALRQQLVRNGRMVKAIPDDLPPDGSLLTVWQGVLYTLSKEDEYSLLECGAEKL